MLPIIALIDDNEMILRFVQRCLADSYRTRTFATPAEALIALESGWYPDLIISDLSMPGLDGFALLERLKNDYCLSDIPVMILSGQENADVREDCLRAGACDFLPKPFLPEDLKERIARQLDRPAAHAVGLPFKVRRNARGVKRVVDIAVSSLLLLLLLPLLLLVALLIRLDSKGPVIYRSRRVGAGYRVFSLYKFRTMRHGADAQLAQLQHLNLYGETAQTSADEAIFLKLKDDPRITRLGRFLRNTSIDELPQLVNIFKGDMSLVGNRPLPTYEAEKLTTDGSAARFMAPAGLTGLWQVTRRGRGDLSARERIELDNLYATRHSFWLDLKLMFKTLPALFQSETM
ncbi:sugar transferase [Tellurirhabdus rosea]|uniref:sugar transferase n=1 Tax=Tellurirhabdus rosea TaxID=2674997 RepID=UPI00224DBEF0|nr:sugar transferase [Tellurirhabdus rosea]